MSQRYVPVKQHYFPDYHEDRVDILIATGKRIATVYGDHPKSLDTIVNFVLDALESHLATVRQPGEQHEQC